MSKFNNYIGIDPDVDKSGVAFLEVKSGVIELSNLTFFQLQDYLRFVKSQSENSGESVLIRIECGFLNKSNWNLIPKNKEIKIDSLIHRAAKIGNNTGANHEVARKLCEMCDYLNLPYEQVRPERSKVNADVFKKISGVIGRTNQEQRDAGMLIVGYKKR